MFDRARSVESQPGATYRDVIDAPEHKVAEIVDGTLYLSPRPPIRAGLAVQSLLFELWTPFDRGEGGPGGWWLLREPELHLGPDVIVPNLVGWRRARLPKLPEGPGIELPPDWVCEAFAPETRALDLRKRAAYAQAGISHLWEIDHTTRTLETFALHAGEWRRVAALDHGETLRIPPFDAITLPLAALWAD